MGHRHVVEIPLHINQREALILDQRLAVVGRLRNAVLGDVLGRVEAMRSDERWQKAKNIAGSKERLGAYRDLRYEYGLYEDGVRRIAFDHWRASRWMGDLIDARCTSPLAAEVFQNVEEWMAGRARRPAFKRTAERSMVWGNDDKAGLVWRGDHVRWNTRRGAKGKLACKSLLMKADLGSLSHARREHLLQSRVVRCGIRRERVRGHVRYFALVTLEGKPYRNADYTATVAPGQVAIDLGPSLVAVTGERESAVLALVEPSRLAKRRHDELVERRRKRALDRSRRVSSPHCFDSKGRWIKGRRQAMLSKRGQKRWDLLSASKRTNAENRLQDRQRVIRQVIRHGTTVAAEAIDYRGWQRSGFGKRMGWTAPGDFMVRLQREADLFGGRLVELPVRLALSQHCLCGAKVKKPLKQRVHHCPSCGLGPLHRDLFSAFLARQVAVSGRTDINLGDAPFNTDEIRGQAIALCSVSPRRAASLTRTQAGNSSHGKRGLKAGDQGNVPGAGTRAKVKPRPQDKASEDQHCLAAPSASWQAGENSVRGRPLDVVAW